MSEIPKRNEVPKEHQWDLSALYPSDEAWEKDFEKLKELHPGVLQFKGRLGESLEIFRETLEYEKQYNELEERLWSYAQLRLSQDVSDGDANGRYGRILSEATQAGANLSFISPEIQSLDDRTIQEYRDHESMSDYQIQIDKLMRYKPHVLSEEAEKILALATESMQTPRKTFSNLTNVDMKFGEMKGSEGTLPLSQSTFSVFLQDPDPEVRKKAYRQFYKEFSEHSNTLASLLSGSVQQDVFRARARGYKSARDMSLFHDDVHSKVYDNLISAVGDHLPSLHEYYSFRKKVLGLEELHHSDVYAPLVGSVKIKTPYEKAVDHITKATSVLGSEYTNTLRAGLLGTWVDRYENKGKRSGAFSAGSYFGDPYILMNYKEDSIRDVFTLAHEGGHSMHSWYSVKNNPFQHYDYTIFEAEVASTFNEQLLAKHLTTTRPDDADFQNYLDSKVLDDTIATIFRQTMFAEYEHIIHREVEEGRGLTLDSLREHYRGLLEKYFGGEVVFDSESDLEGLRIPHFYSAFYVYKYATGLSAATALAKRVTGGGSKELQDYLGFLSSGGSRFPIESLKVAGVDMSSPDPIHAALAVFEEKMSSLKKRMS